MLAFDHLVIASKNPEKTFEEAKEKHQWKGAKGGHHEPWGTYNYLSHFRNNSYIEWIGIEDYEKAFTSDNPLIQHLARSIDERDGRPIHFALRTNDMDAILREWETKRVAYSGPFPGSRKKADGTMLKWRMLFPEGPTVETLLPFLIEWDGDNQPGDLNDLESTHVNMGVESLEKAADLFQLYYPLGTQQSESGKIKWQLENGSLSLDGRKGIRAEFGGVHLS
ncbi:VOC family protein [Thalassobacillus hwangdonensis]|uniref:VOC family protein n=1 Tax=Thalassobacillus hwangdonensis TaxID=546108 RepID=A0ABW3L1Q2_9BACI